MSGCVDFTKLSIDVGSSNASEFAGHVATSHTTRARKKFGSRPILQAGHARPLEVERSPSAR